MKSSALELVAHIERAQTAQSILPIFRDRLLCLSLCYFLNAHNCDECPLLALSGHRLARCKCPVLTPTSCNTFDKLLRNKSSSARVSTRTVQNVEVT